MLVPFGFKDGRIVHVDEVENGKDCGVICPACNQSLVAKNNCKSKSNHFAHDRGAECNSYAAMTYLHMYAQLLIEKDRKIVLPAVLYRIEAQLSSGDIVAEIYQLSRAKGVTFDRVSNEEPFGDYRIDCVGYKGNQSVAVEVKVTHESTLDKTKAFRESGQLAIEIDLSRLHDAKLLSDLEQIRLAILNPDNIIWLSEPLMMEDRHRADLDFSKKVKEHQQAIDMQEQMLRDQEHSEQRRFKAAYQKVRASLLQPLNWLNTVMSPSWIDQWEQMKSFPVKSLIRQTHIESYGKLIDIPVNGEWVFNTSRKYWQALVLYYLDHNDSCKLGDIKKFVLEQVGIHPMMHTLNTSRFNAKRIAKQKGINVDWNSFWFLTVDEQSRLLDPYVLVKEYIEKLIRLNIVSRAPFANTYHVNGGRLSVAIEAILKQEELSKKSNQNLLKMKQRRQDFAEYFLKNRDEKIEDLVAADHDIFNQHNGVGLRCVECRIIWPSSMVKSHKQCKRCGSEKPLREDAVSAEYLEQAIHRYRCLSLL
ncbi:hypothetical protein AB4587_01600 [Vibrio breoganii]